MSTIQIHMLGKLEMVVDNRSINSFHCQKALELFCYLILFCDRPHNWEQLAEIFW
jgi:DNA-binding SARP family transcriptional activator